MPSRSKPSAKPKPSATTPWKGSRTCASASQQVRTPTSSSKRQTKNLVIPWRKFSLSIRPLTERRLESAMLFNYRYVRHDIEKFQTWLDHLVKKVWCRSAGAYSLNLLHTELKAV